MVATAGAPPHAPQRLPTPDGLLCPKCGAAEFVTRWQRFKDGSSHVRADCARCGKFVRYLEKPGAPEPQYTPRRPEAHEQAAAPPPASWWWIGMVRPSDGVWRAVALAPTVGRCWDTLLHCHLEGDYLLVPTHPPRREP